MAWTAKSLSIATCWSMARSQGWLDGISDYNNGVAKSIERPDYDKYPNDMFIKDSIKKWEFGYHQAVNYSQYDAPIQNSCNQEMEPDNSSQEEFIRIAHTWWGFGDNTDGVPEPEDCHWRYEENFPLESLVNRMPDGLKGWKNWFRNECRNSMEDGRDGYGYLVPQIQLEEIVFTVVDGHPYIWDGWHRTGAAIVRSMTGNGSPTIKAIIGEPKPELILNSKF